ncbi:MFS transporter [Ferruginibacter paludis]|uniref:MFS transporter n=1 Tax=Ferruginibacter paludis TaxID=1310417 RepID=UPI0025B387AE|nr:MFS transporter [Ferruginibacter paludis]MDN3654685.1 MFS transporter [Ferruginibacter paludis]
MALANHPLAVLKITEFRNFILGRFVFIMGLRMMGTLVSWWMYELTGDAFYIGMIGLAEAIPAIGLALYAGYVIDRSEKRRLLLITISLYAMCTFILLGTSTQWFSQQFGTKLIIIFIYSIVFITGAIRAFSGPSFGAMIASLVPKHLLIPASQLSSTSWLIASISGHALAGFLIAWLHVTGTFVIITSLIITGFLLLSRLTPKPPGMSSEKKTLEAVAEGLKYVFKTKEVLGAITLDLFAVLFGGAVAMVPVYAKDILHVGPIGFGWLNAASDIGSISMVIALTLNPMKKKQGIKLFMAVTGFGLCIILFGLSKWYWLSFVALVAGGIFDGVSVVVRGNIMQLKTPDELRGRVLSVNSMFINSSNEIGQFESGVAAKLMGVIPSVVFGGCMTILVVVATWIKAPSLKKLEY